MGKKRFFANHAKSSAMLVSVAIHAVLIVVAISFVAVKVIVKEDQVFVEQRVKRPKMPPKKIQVPVETKKRKPQPKLRKRIVSERKIAEIKMPEITGIKGGLGNMGGDGLGSLGFDIKIDLFGADRSQGNELVGSFYDLKQSPEKKPTGIGTKNREPYWDALSSFTRSFKPSRLDDFFQAPQKKYGTFLWTPYMQSSEGTKAFGVEATVTPTWWAAHYSGHIRAPETGEYRFVGLGDNVLIVAINNNVVLDACYQSIHGTIANRSNNSDDDMKWPIIDVPKKDKKYVELARVGRWVQLTKGQKIPIDILIGDGGGQCYYRLLIQQRGKQYPMVEFNETAWNAPGHGHKQVTGSRPVLPIFKLTEIPAELHGKMGIDPNIATLDGPTFGALEQP